MADIREIDDLHDVDVDADLDERLQEIYATTLPSRLTAIASGARSGDPVAVASAALTLAGTSGQLGYPEVASLCQEIAPGRPPRRADALPAGRAPDARQRLTRRPDDQKRRETEHEHHPTRLTLIGLTAAVLIGGSIPASATFSEAVTISTTTGTATITPPTQVEAKNLCTTTVDPVTQATTTTTQLKVEWWQSTSPRTTGYRVTVHPAGAAYALAVTGPTDEVFLTRERRHQNPGSRSPP